MEQTGMIVGILGGILGAVGVAVSIILGIISWKRTHRRDIASAASKDTAFQIDIAYIKRGIDDIRKEQQDMRLGFERLLERVARVEEAARLAHRRLDEHIGMYDPEADCSDKQQ